MTLALFFLLLLYHNLIIMKHFISVLLLLLCLGCQEKTPVAKYVFFFIGDGMGLGQVALAEAYQAAQDGKTGNYPLNFSQFPVLGTATTYSASNVITCSSAAGTALATGEKTNNGMLGVRPDTSDLTAITYKIKDAGYKVGVTSTVTLDHATPGAFYAHSSARSDYYSISTQLPASGFDFFGGGGFLQPLGAQEDQESVFSLIEKAGYTVAYGLDEFNELKAKNEKMVLLQDKDRNYLKDLPYAIDRKDGDLTQAGIVAAAVEFLDNEKGFFLMSEGGKIDWACHSNDGKTALMEVLDMADAVQVAIAFAQKHPDETLIVVTADHETGGLALGSVSEYVMFFNELDPQSQSKDALFANGQKDEALLVSQMNAMAKIGWTTSAHTGIPVPVYATGTYSGLFGGRMDNTDIPKKICQAMGVAY